MGMIFKHLDLVFPRVLFSCFQGQYLWENERIKWSSGFLFGFSILGICLLQNRRVPWKSKTKTKQKMIFIWGYDDPCKGFLILPGKVMVFGLAGVETEKNMLFFGEHVFFPKVASTKTQVTFVFIPHFSSFFTRRSPVSKKIWGKTIFLPQTWWSFRVVIHDAYCMIKNKTAGETPDLLGLGRFFSEKKTVSPHPYVFLIETKCIIPEPKWPLFFYWKGPCFGGLKRKKKQAGSS